MIIHDVYDDRGIFSVFIAQSFFALLYYRMIICKKVDLMVQFYAIYLLAVEVFPLCTTHRISNKVTDHNVIIVIGE